ncbi:MAG TPA: hybrid sensor histidine kinase/response regulator [Gemmatimonadales bacterium]|nr:hybrid sensor histidine kinase/response regulator [Gemmatimonadales bacterium]
MELWVAFGFGAAVGALVGYLLGRRREVPAAVARVRPTPAPPAQPPPSKISLPPDLKHVVLDEGSANVLNALNNRLAAIGALADLLHGSPLDPERARALVLLHGEVRRAAEITSHFLDLAAHPAGAAEPCDASVVINGVLAERESTIRELGVKVHRQVASALPMVACPMAQLSEIFTKLVDFALRRLRASQPPRELRLEAIATGPSIVISLWDSGSPLSVEAEQRLVSPFRFTQSGGGGEVEFALARALAQSAGGSLRLRPRGGGSGAEVVITLPRSLLGAQPPLAAPAENLPRMRILVVDDDAVNRQAMVMLLEREGHQVTAVENGVEAMLQLDDHDKSFDAVVTDLQMPRLGGRAMYEQLVTGRPLVAKRFVFVTGDQARGETRAFLENCGQPSVTKPYDLSDLINAIGTVARKK